METIAADSVGSRPIGFENTKYYQDVWIKSLHENVRMCKSIQESEGSCGLLHGH